MKVYICTPTHSGTVHVPFVISVLNLVKILTLSGIEVAWEALSFSSFIQSARNQMAQKFMESDYTDLLFIDADVGFEVEGVLKMLLRDVDVIGIPVIKRQDKEEFTINLLKDANGNRIEKDGMMEVASVATAILRIRRNVFENWKGGRFFDAMYEGDRMLGEDVWFCRKFREQGGRIWIEPNVLCSHTGQKSWVGKFTKEQ